MNKGKILRKIAGLATGAMFLGSIMGAASVFAANSVNFGSLPSPFVMNGKVNSVIVIGANAAPTDVAGAISIASALTAAAAGKAVPTASGIVQIGTLTTTALASKSTYYSSTSPTIEQVGPITLYNASYNVSNSKYVAKENLTISNAVINTTTLSVQIPGSGVAVMSYVTNKSSSPASIVDKPFVGEEFYVGKTPYMVVNVGTSSGSVENVSFGTIQSFTNLKMPQSVTVNGNSITLEGLVVQYSSSTQTNQLEVSVNNGAITDIPLGTTTKVGNVYLTPSAVIQNSSGQYVTSLQVSAVSFTLNESSTTTTYTYNGSMFNEPGYNVTLNNNGELVFTKNTGITLPYSFNSTSSAAVGFGMTNVTLFPLTVSTSGTASPDTYTVTVGPAGTMSLLPLLAYNSTSPTSPLSSASSTTLSNYIAFGYYNPLPGVEIGQSFRGSLTTAGVGSVPSLFILPNQTLYNVSSGEYDYAQSGFIYPTPSGKLPANGQNYYYGKSSIYNWSSGTLTLTDVGYSNNVSTATYLYFPAKNPAGSAERVIVSLPNGNYIAVQYTFEPETSYYVWNITQLLLYNSSTVSNPRVITNMSSVSNMSYHGYTLTVSPVKIKIGSTTTTVNATALKIRGPEVTLSGPNSVAGSLLPGYSGIYVGGIAKSNLKGSYNEVLSFNGKTLTVTLPDGESLSLNIAENASTFATSFVSPVNQTTKWGATLITKGNKTTITVPTDNYTLAIGGSKVITGVQNYTVGQQVPSGVIKSIGGVTTSLTPSGLFASGMSPANIMALSNEYNPSSASVPVIIVGGPAINPMAALALTGNETPIYGAKFENLTGVSNGESLIELFANSKYFNNQTVMLVAGYSGNDTLEASQVLSMALIGEPVVSIPANATKVILKSGATYTGVSVASS